MLNLHSRSAIAAMFTETGIIPLRVRRFLLVLSHLNYFLGLNHTDYARAALDGCDRLDCQALPTSTTTITSKGRAPDADNYKNAALSNAREDAATSDALVQLRTTFLSQLFLNAPHLQKLIANCSNTEFLKAMIYSRPNIALVAKFACAVLEFFYAVPVLRP
jgi:hypothetical protein